MLKVSVTWKAGSDILAHNPKILRPKTMTIRDQILDKS